MFAHVSFPISSFNTFSYSIPKSLIKEISLGTCVNAPIKNNLQSGFVIKIDDRPRFSGKILDIHSIKDKTFHLPVELWKTINWLSQYYVVPLGQVLKAAIPNTFLNPYKPNHVKYVEITINGKKELKKANYKKPAQKKVLLALSKIEKPVKISDLSNLVSAPYIICKKLALEGFIIILLQPKVTDPFDILKPNITKNIILSKEQQKIFNQINESQNIFLPFLLHGVTGSGKTEVYMKLAQKIIKKGKSVLVLVPEIALTPQIANRFNLAFGNQIALWHSRMTKSEKGWTWQQIKKGNYSIIIGARSAIFTPIKNLGLIIIDEEQEASFKQENPAPRYHARDVAIIRGKYANAMVLLASATPSLESYYNCIQKKYTLLKLTKRYGNSIYPKVELIDMKKQAVNNLIPLISESLSIAIEQCLKKSEQIILLQNRRGYSLVQQCKSCGNINTCERCEIAMTYHKTDNYMHCHYCKTSKHMTIVCNQCKTNSMNFKGAGTQKVERIIRKQFPGIRILRMDMDTVQKKGNHEKILNQFAEGNADILLGTQMIAKGLDFENVTLVGIINADSGLFFPDFRSGEKVFQLIYQVAGRSGRRKKPGKAIIQTFNPNDLYIKAASSLNTSKYYNMAMAQRQELNYPPFSRIGRIIFKGTNKNNVNNIAIKTFKKLQGNQNYNILGPAPAPLEKIRDMWRSHLVIKSFNKKTGNISRFLYENIGFSIFEKKWRGVQIILDIDPISMM